VDDGGVNDSTSPRSSFVPLDRTGIEVLSFLECERLLAAGAIGRVATVVRGEPVILPVNYQYVNGCVVFRSASGEKTGAASMRQPMSFEIDEWDLHAKAGWSVLIKGFGDLMADDHPMALAAVTLRPWATATERDIWMRIVPNEITGRRVGP
jgi:nitroimidazol reductase NimA-like FMN-containing flavoprotein (pyridoxamine 5'-phosphate oxidase superfamily)